MRDELGSDTLGSARLVLNDDTLPKLRGQRVGDNAGHDIGCAAGSDRHHDFE
jgi:hypothetical protein